MVVKIVHFCVQLEILSLMPSSNYTVSKYFGVILKTERNGSTSLVNFNILYNFFLKILSRFRIIPFFLNARTSTILLSISNIILRLGRFCHQMSSAIV